ncbi:hypothetical protein BS47DRAFT_854896 [Hydnum rufescens UP504]|uniref:Uncharacterized protein n=1 Tax=Hydnum rufescens UP504 TaxID=1448309 RepID=A0A9P6DY87_9AGAM|nr:hypothetical protein BS47DRAFT_854896 [Hydnum rufescens UP504]
MASTSPSNPSRLHISHQKMDSNARSRFLKRLAKGFQGPRRFVQLFSKQLSSPDFSLVKRPLDSAELSPQVQPSEESSLALPRVESTDHTQSRQSQTAFVQSPPPVLNPNYDYPLPTLKIKTGSGGSAQGPIAIGGDAGDIGYINERPRIDLANSGEQQGLFSFGNQPPLLPHSRYGHTQGLQRSRSRDVVEVLAPSAL